jgi:hypothetical protein
MAIALDWPPQILAAAAVKFSTPIGALLWMPEIDYPCLVGRVFMDLSGRFQDGRLIRTSQILRLMHEDGWTIAHTFSGSHYLLVQAEGNAFSGLSKLRLMCPEPEGNVH